MKRSSNNNNNNKKKKKHKTKINLSDYYGRVKKEVQLREGPNKEFGGVDQKPDVEEMTDPEKKKDVEITDPEDVEKVTEDEVEIIYSKPAQVFPHERQYCPTHKFDVSNTIGNRMACPKCYCFVCNKPVSQCEDWYNPDCYNPELRNHCNAHLSDNNYWQVKKWFQLNPVQNILYNYITKDNDGTIQQTKSASESYDLFERVRLRLNRSFKLYEAGEEKIVQINGTGQKIWFHNFKHVTTWFDKLFSATRMVKTEPNWINKFIQLDAMTEAIVTRTWRPPKDSASSSTKWDPTAEESYGRIMLCLGSGWFTCFAKCNEENRVELSKAIQSRISHLKTVAKDPILFDNGFKTLLRISRHGQNTSEAAEDILRACTNIYRIILTRRLKFVQLPDSDKYASAKYHAACLKDSIMLPFLDAIKNHNSTYCQQINITKRCEALSRKMKFYTDPSIEKLMNMYVDRNQITVTKDDLNDMITYMKHSLVAKYTYSTRRRLKCEKIVRYTMCFFAIAIHYTDIVEEAVGYMDKGISMLLEEINKGNITKSMERLIFEACMELSKMFAATNRALMKKTWPSIVKVLNVAKKIAKENSAYEKEQAIIVDTLKQVEGYKKGSLDTFVIDWTKNNTSSSSSNNDNNESYLKYGSNHQLSYEKTHVEQLEKGNPNLLTWYEYTFNQIPLGIQVDCQSAEPVILSISNENVKKTMTNIKKGDVIHSINGKIVRDLWRFLALDIRQEDFLIKDPDTNEVVPSQYIVHQMKFEFEKYLKTLQPPLRIGFTRYV